MFLIQSLCSILHSILHFNLRNRARHRQVRHFLENKEGMWNGGVSALTYKLVGYLQGSSVLISENSLKIWADSAVSLGPSGVCWDYPSRFKENWLKTSIAYLVRSRVFSETNYHLSFILPLLCTPSLWLDCSLLFVSALPRQGLNPLSLIVLHTYNMMVCVLTSWGGRGWWIFTFRERERIKMGR